MPITQQIPPPNGAPIEYSAYAPLAHGAITLHTTRHRTPIRDGLACTTVCPSRWAYGLWHGVQVLCVEGEMIFDEACDKEVAMVVMRVPAQRQLVATDVFEPLRFEFFF